MRHLRVSSITTALATASLTFATPAAAGGLYIWEFGHPAQGASGAGAGALAQDASTAFLNPAGITFLDESDWLASGVIIDTSVKFTLDQDVSGRPPAVADSNGDRPAGTGGDAGSTVLGGGFWYARPVNDKWGWGISLGSISGAALEYEGPADFAGRYWATEVELLTINVTPALSYKVSDNFSLGFSLPIMFGTLDMDVAIPGVAAGANDGRALIQDGDDTQVTFSLSAMWQATERLRLGAMYLGEIDIEFDSDLSLTLPPGAEREDVAAAVGFTYPQTVRTWAAYELNDRVTLLGTLAWEDWSAFDSIAISTPIAGAALPRNWDDTWHVGAGLQIATSGPWTWSTGIAYDGDPTRPEDRTADMPIDEQWRLSVGANYRRANGHRFGVVATYADYGDAAIDNGGNRPVSGAPWTVKGHYSTNRIWFLGVNYGW